MSAETKRREILQMLAGGSISAQEAGDLLQQINEPAEPTEQPAEPQREPEVKKPRWLNVRVADMESGRHKVSVRIPLGLARFGLKIGARYAPEIRDMDWDEILDQISTLEDQTLVEVQDEEDGEHVQIFVN